MTAELSELNAVVAEFPPEVVRKVIEYAKALASPVPPTGMPYWERPGYSDEWTEEDMRDAAVASMRRFEEQHPGEDWSDLRQITPKGYK